VCSISLKRERQQDPSAGNSRVAECRSRQANKYESNLYSAEDQRSKRICSGLAVCNYKQAVYSKSSATADKHRQFVWIKWPTQGRATYLKKFLSIRISPCSKSVRCMCRQKSCRPRRDRHSMQLPQRGRRNTSHCFRSKRHSNSCLKLYRQMKTAFTFYRTVYYSGPGNEALGRLCASMSACLYPYNNFLN